MLLLLLVSFDQSLIPFLLFKLELVCQRSLGFEEWQFVWNVQVWILLGQMPILLIHLVFVFVFLLFLVRLVTNCSSSGRACPTES